MAVGKVLRTIEPASPAIQLLTAQSIKPTSLTACRTLEPKLRVPSVGILPRQFLGVFVSKVSACKVVPVF